MTTAIDTRAPLDSRTTTWREATRVLRGRRSAALGTAGLLLLVIGAWGGIVPFVGPLFGFSATGTPAWEWNLSHALLGVLPGAVACVAGLTLVIPRVSTVGWRRLGLTIAGLVTIASGAWFVVGPVAWPVLASGPYFVPADPLTELRYQLGYSLGPGLIITACGAFALGWAVRHRSPLNAPEEAAATAVPAPTGAAEAAPDVERPEPATVAPTNGRVGVTRVGDTTPVTAATGADTVDRAEGPPAGATPSTVPATDDHVEVPAAPVEPSGEVSDQPPVEAPTHSQGEAPTEPSAGERRVGDTPVGSTADDDRERGPFGDPVDSAGQRVVRPGPEPTD